MTNKMRFLNKGNTAKMYCLDWISKFAENRGEIKILDLGCGTGEHFLEILKKHPNIYYCGIEPSKTFQDAQKNLEGLNAQVINRSAYGIEHHLNEKFDIVVYSAFLSTLSKKISI